MHVGRRHRKSSVGVRPSRPRRRCGSILIFEDASGHARGVMDLLIVLLEGFNDWGGRGYDDFVTGEVTKTAPSGDRTT